MSDIADSTIAFSAYGMLCGCPGGIGRDGLHAALLRAGFVCERPQFERAIDALLSRSWARETDGAVALVDTGCWVPFARKRSGNTETADWDKTLGWDGWCVRGPLGETLGLVDRLKAIGETAE